VGYSFFDYAVNGVKPADFVMIAGASGYGKSTMLANMAANVWLQENTIDNKVFTPGKNVVYFSLEMPYEDCFNRFISRISKVPSRKIENAEVSKEELTKIRQSLDFINTYPNHFKIVDIADATANDIELIITELPFQVDAVFIDYLGIMKPNEIKRDIADHQIQGEIAYEVRAIGRKHNIPLFSAVQLNRKAGTKDDETIGLNRLARSNTISTHCTTVIQIENRPNEEMFPDFPYHLIKNRKGIKGKGMLVKHLNCAYLEDIPYEAPDNMDTYFPSVDVDDISEEMEELEL
jgi:replicative DNA helicase